MPAVWVGVTPAVTEDRNKITQPRSCNNSIGCCSFFFSVNSWLGPRLGTINSFFCTFSDRIYISLSCIQKDFAQSVSETLQTSSVAALISYLCCVIFCLRFLLINSKSYRFFLPLPPAAAYDECSPVTVEKSKIQLVSIWDYMTVSNRCSHRIRQKAEEVWHQISKMENK